MRAAGPARSASGCSARCRARRRGRESSDGRRGVGAGATDEGTGWSPTFVEPLPIDTQSCAGITCSPAVHYLRDWSLPLQSLATVLRRATPLEACVERQRAAGSHDVSAAEADERDRAEN